jgi:two-component system, chemotaxis family, sensor kinase CheA
MDEDRELIQAFSEEAAELLESFEQGLLELEQAPDNAETLHRIFRAAHTIKGNSAMLGFTAIAEFTHGLEDVLDRLRKGRLTLTPDGMALLLQALDVLKLMLRSPGAPAPDTAALAAGLAGYAARAAGAPPAPPPPAPVLAPKLGEILLAQEAVTPEQLADALGFQEQAGKPPVEEGRVSPEQVAKVREAAGARPKEDAASIRVPTDKIDKLVNLVGELVITQSMLAQSVARFSWDQLPHLTEAVAAMERHSRELQERVMAVRMQPLKTVFSRFHRLVRDMAEKLGKAIRLEVSGEDTELDKTVIDQIGDPLTHLVRNCVDHGLEGPADRQAAGKPAQGVVRLHAFHQGGSIFIEIGDDGRGLDLARIRRKALDTGVITAEEPLTEAEVAALIFRPGFSTAACVTDLSGRGVGLDVVQRNVTALHGQVTVASQPGQGATFTIQLPLTLAILDGLSVTVGAETYIVPLVSVTESIRPAAAQVATLVGRGEVVTVRERVLPILRLGAVLGRPARVRTPSEGLLVIVEHGADRVALLVDEIVGQQQVVIKSLEANYRRLEGVSGATVMGDGRVALILDIPGLVQLAGRALVAA